MGYDHKGLALTQVDLHVVCDFITLPNFSVPSHLGGSQEHLANLGWVHPPKVIILGCLMMNLFLVLQNIISYTLKFLKSELWIGEVGCLDDRLGIKHDKLGSKVWHDCWC